jgi:nickel transport protein
LNLFAQGRGTRISGRVYFSGDIAARQVDVLARNASGRELDRTKTDDDGRFTITARARVDYFLTAETIDGHSATYLLSAAELSDGLPTNDATSASTPAEPADDVRPRDTVGALGEDSTASNASTEVLQQQIERLRDQIDQLEHRLQFRDILGGIGYILGLAGIAMYMKSRRTRVA